MRPSIILSAALAVLAASSAAHAQFMVDPACGTTLSTVYHDDQSYNGRSIGIPFSYYGQAITTVDVCTNGFLSFTGDTSFYNLPLPTGVQRICPMWDDLYVYVGNTIRERVVPGSYYSVTWQLSTYDFGHVYQECQVILIGNSVRLYGFDFQPNDIVFCYASVGAPPWNATIGLEGPSGQFTPLPGTTNGYLSDANASLLPNFTNSVQWILFRPNGAGGYDARVLPCVADVDDGTGTGTRDGGVTIDDLLYFLNRFDAGC